MTRVNDPDYRRLKAKTIPLPSAYEALEPNKVEVTAIQALNRGEATPAQQKIALDFILMASDPTGGVHAARDRDRDEVQFSLGRAFTKLQLLGILKINLTYFIRKENENAS